MNVLSLSDKARVFNMRVLPLLLKSLHKINGNDKYIMFKYKFKTDMIAISSPVSVDIFKGTFNYKHNMDRNVYERLMENVHPDSEVIIGIFYHSVDGTFDSSIYGFKRRGLSRITMGTPEKKATLHPSINNGLLRRLVNWDRIVDIIIGQQEDGFDVIYITTDPNNEYIQINGVNSIGLAEVLKLKFKIGLVDLETRRFIRDNARRYNYKIIILNLINLLTDYFLVIKYELVDDKCILSFIPSPADDTLRESELIHVVDINRLDDGLTCVNNIDESDDRLMTIEDIDE